MGRDVWEIVEHASSIRGQLTDDSVIEDAETTEADFECCSFNLAKVGSLPSRFQVSY